jgi:hypothetical protein
LQAILFYAPRWLWKSWEGGKLQALKMDLDVGIMTQVDKKQKQEMILSYLQSNRQYHNFWAFKYFFCEFLALINVIGTRADRLDAQCQDDMPICLLLLFPFLSLTTYFLRRTIKQ